jgi:hypothetical protein
VHLFGCPLGAVGRAVKPSRRRCARAQEVVSAELIMRLLPFRQAGRQEGRQARRRAGGQAGSTQQLKDWHTMPLGMQLVCHSVTSGMPWHAAGSHASIVIRLMMVQAASTGTMPGTCLRRYLAMPGSDSLIAGQVHPLALVPQLEVLLSPRHDGPCRCGRCGDLRPRWNKPPDLIPEASTSIS